MKDHSSTKWTIYYRRIYLAILSTHSFIPKMKRSLRGTSTRMKCKVWYPRQVHCRRSPTDRTTIPIHRRIQHLRRTGERSRIRGGLSNFECCIVLHRGGSIHSTNGSSSLECSGLRMLAKIPRQMLIDRDIEVMIHNNVIWNANNILS